MLTLRTLGALRLEGPEGELLRGRRKELALLAYVARRATPLSREELADAFWGSRPGPQARQSLRQALLQVKRALPAGLDAESDTVALSPTALALDVTLFERDLAAGRLEAAVDRWQGDFLAGCDDVGSAAFGAWLDAERQGLRARLQAALADLADRAAQQGDLPAALQWAERWADLFPHDDGAATRVIHALNRMGRTAEARGRHAAFVTRLRQDLEVEPTPEFLRLGSDLALPATAPRPTPASGVLFTPEFVGRSSALEALRRAWELATAGATTLVLVEGDEGIGKTRLCEEFVRTLPRDAVVLRARAREADREVAYATAREWLARLSEAPGLAGARPGALAAVGDLVPALGSRFPGAAAAAPDASLGDALADVLSAVAAEAPLLLVVDDFPLADRDSRDLILVIARRVRHAPACVVLTSRTDDTPAELLAELRGRVGETRIRLAPLSEPAVQELLGSMLEMAPAVRETVARRLYQESGGNPLHLIETTAALLDEGRLTPDARGRWEPAADLADGKLPVPPTVRAAARRRVEALSTPARRVAEAGAVLTAQATAERLGQVTRLPAEEVDAALEELQLRRVLRSPAGSGAAYEFAHEANRRAVLDGLTGTQRRRLHGRALQALRAGPDAATPATLDYHRRRAGALGGRLPPWLGLRAGLAIAAGLVGVLLVGRGLWSGPATGFAERDWVILADLDNATAEPIFDESLSAALFVSISQSQHVNVFPPTRIRETTRRMRLDSVPRITEQLAREVAQREGIRAVVTLTITGAEPAYALTSRIVDPESGRTLATLRTAASQDRVLAALDELAVEVRRTLGESAREIRDRRVSLPQASTSSLEALKLFAEGSRALDQGRTGDGIVALQAAVALDSAFAWAHAMLGRYLVWLNTPLKAAPHLERALALADRLPPRERLWVRRLIAEGQQDRPEAVRLAREYLREYPDDRDAWFALGRTLQEAQDHEGALEAFRRAVEIDPRSAGALVNSALLYDLTGRPREAVATFERAVAVDSSLVTQIAGDVNRIYGFARLRTGDSAGARAVFERLLDGTPGQQANARRSLALLDTYYGRYGRAAEGMEQAARLSAAANSPVGELRNRLYLAGILRARGQVAAAHEQLRRAQIIRGRSPGLPLSWLGFLGQHLARTGMLEDAERVRAEMLARERSSESYGLAAIALVEGEIGLAHGHADSAVAALSRAVDLAALNYTRQGLARALAAAGRPQDAIAVYREMLRDSALGGEVQEPWLVAHYELGALYDELGDSAAALPLYRKLAALWRGADDDVPMVRALRRRLARAES